VSKYVQDSPFALQIELCQGCNLRCTFCGINGITEKAGGPYKFMARDTLTSLITQVTDLGWNPRVEFAMHGEPTMHPDYVGMIAAAYSIHPKLQLMLTTNGGGLLRPPGAAENIKALFRNGLNILALDDYDGIKIVDKIRPILNEVCRELQINWFDYPAFPEGNPHKRVKDPFITIIEDISKETGEGTHARLSNHSGSAAPLDYSMINTRCARPFRELSVRWDGNVAISCNDWEGRYKCGNVITDGLLAIWHGEAFDAARRKLYHGQRNFGPCLGCNDRSHRVGLLPDKKGRYEMPEPDEETEEIIKRALEGPSYTQRVRRPWHDAHDVGEKRPRGVESRNGIPEMGREPGVI
jgi:hypothetical protein